MHLHTISSVCYSAAPGGLMDVYLYSDIGTSLLCDSALQKRDATRQHTATPRVDYAIAQPKVQ